MSLPGLDLPTLSFAPAAEDQADTLTVDTDHLITSRLLIQGSSGAGKGWAIRTLLEQTHGRVQQLVLDKEGEFSTLRERYDYILAGGDGDVPATPKTARVLCRHLMELGASAVIDLYDLTNADRRAFVRDFLTELMALPKEFWRPLLVVIDEAHFYAPEGAPSEAAAAVISLCSEGRKRGFSAVLATQRLSKLSKDAAADLHNKMIGLTGLDVDVRRAADELGFGKDQAATLKKLKAGQFCVYGPALSPEVTLVRTGAIQTTHPKAGQIASYTPPPAEAVRALLEQLKGLAEEADAEVRAEQEKADRTAALERQVETLTKQLMETPVSAAPVETVEKIVEKIVEKVVRVPALEPQQIERLGAIADMLAATSKDAMNMAQEIRAGLAQVNNPRPPIKSLIMEEDIAGLTATDALMNASGIPTEENSPALSSKSAQNTQNPPAPNQKTEGSLTRPQQMILNTLADLAALGIKQPQRVHVGLFAGVSPSSSAFTNNLGALRTAGLLAYPVGGYVMLTDRGREAAQGTGRPLTVRELQQAWLARLTAPQRRIVETLIACYPNKIVREALAHYAGASSTSSAFTNNLGALRSLGLVDYPAKGQVVATALLFPSGLPE